MHQDIDPLRLRDRLQRTLARYISTAVPVSHTRAPRLAHAVREKLDAISPELTKGPFLESLPDFEKKGSIRELVDDGILSDHWHMLQEMGFERLLDRPFHVHQETAIQQATKGRNIIVATGTGSGKTECFLLPIVDRLLRDGELSEPGVRVIIIYPLNALANDQLYFRLAPLLLRHLGDPGITFGRFTGQVKSNAKRPEEESRLLDNEALRDALGLDISVSKLSGSWLLSRSEMLKTPPHILVTNYAMLEHLLLLPRNTPLFHNARLRFIVLDEIHTYAGAQAIEVAFLLRKLKVRLGLKMGALQAVGTSASLNIDDRQNLAQFASDLFGEEFDANIDLISGIRKIHPALQTKVTELQLGAEKWNEVGEVISVMQAEEVPTVEEWNEYCEDIDDHLQLKGHDLKKALANCLSKISEVRLVANELTDGIRAFEDLARKVFPDTESNDICNKALRSLIATAVFACPDNSEFPILPARYHLAVSGIDGGVLRLDAESEEGWSDFRPKKSHNDESNVPYFSLLPCRNCGEPYLEGWCKSGMIFGKPIAGASRTVFRIATLEKSAAIEMGIGEDDSLNEDEKYLYINPETGVTDHKNSLGSVKIILCKLEEDKDEKQYYLRRCVVCGNRALRFPEPITPMHPGDDALAAVSTQVLLEELPNPDENISPRPLGGRKLLAFSDNRQDAAFFAPFFERTSLDLTLRTCIAHAVKQDEAGIPLRQVHDSVWRLLDDNGQIAYKVYHGSQDMSNQSAKDILFAQIVAEFFAQGRMRMSLEGLGITSVEYDGRSLDRVVKAVCSVDAGLSYDETIVFVELTLDRIRRERLITDQENKLDLSDPAIWGPFKNQKNRCMVLERSSSREPHHILGLLPRGSTSNRSTWILESRLNLSRHQAFQVLREFWHHAIKERLLLRNNSKGYGLNLEKLCVTSGIGLRFYECDTCGTRTFRSMRSICPAWKCKGNLSEISTEDRHSLKERNHYANLYLQKTNRIGLGRNTIAREHSAAIGGYLRETIEEDFRVGKVNLLSCTTTLELGVDLGDLEAIVCKNIPPGITNYQQRTGRAGRRAQAAPVALTIARNSNYDQACFERFDHYLSDRPIVPYLALNNAVFFRRHQVSMILAQFFRKKIVKDSAGTPQLKDLLHGDLSDKNVKEFMDNFRKWLESDGGIQAQEDAQCLVSTLPEKIHSIGIQDGKIVEHVCKELNRFVFDVAYRWQLLQKRRMEARQDNRDNIAAIMQRQQSNLLNQFLVSALSRSAVIPTYSFPVHTCRLEIIKGRGQRPTPFGDLDADLQLDRSAALAITEYAPGAEVVAGGRIWTSEGIVRYPKDFMPTQMYRVCSECGHVDIKDDHKSLGESCSQCFTPRKGSHTAGQFIEPKGFLTSIKGRRGKNPGATRLRQRPADEARLITRAPAHRYKKTDLSGVQTFFAPAFPLDGNQDFRGRMFIVNRGNYGGGYLRCSRCEYSMPATQDMKFGKVVEKRHLNPRTGDSCPAIELSWPVDLGHIFETDVRAFSFDKPIPSINDSDGAKEENFLRTLAEVIRLASVRLLQIDSRDLVATFQRDYIRPVTILFDSVPGGAGYAKRIGNEQAFTTTRLIKAAVDVLRCQKKCASSCMRCLNDYGNQAHWEKFDRHIVLDWLHSLV